MISSFFAFSAGWGCKSGGAAFACRSAGTDCQNPRLLLCLPRGMVIENSQNRRTRICRTFSFWTPARAASRARAVWPRRCWRSWRVRSPRSALRSSTSGRWTRPRLPAAAHWQSAARFPTPVRRRGRDRPRCAVLGPLLPGAGQALLRADLHRRRHLPLYAGGRPGGTVPRCAAALCHNRRRALPCRFRVRLYPRAFAAVFRHPGGALHRGGEPRPRGRGSGGDSHRADRAALSAIFISGI